MGLGVLRGQNQMLSVRSAVCPLCYLLINHWTKLNQIWCVSYSHEWDARRQFFLGGPAPWSLGRGQKVKYHLISITKIFIPNFVCVLTNEIQNISDRIFILSPGSCPRGRTWGCPGGQKKFFSIMFMSLIKSMGMTCRTECK